MALSYFARWFGPSGALVAYLALSYDATSLAISSVVEHNDTDWAMTDSLFLESNNRLIATRVVAPHTEGTDSLTRNHLSMVDDPLGPQEPITVDRYTTTTTWAAP